MIDAILDPSAILQQGRIDYFRELAERNSDRLEIFLPSVFFNMSKLPEHTKAEIGRYFRPAYKSGATVFSEYKEPNYGRGLLKNVRDASEFNEKLRKHEEFLYILRRETPNEIVYQILSEEWVFMNEYSYIASRIKAGFNAFMRTGSSYLIAGKRTMEECLQATANAALKRPADSPLDAFSIFRASCKYIAAGGSSIGTTVLSGNLGIGVALTSGMFLVMDP